MSATHFDNQDRLSREAIPPHHPHTLRQATATVLRRCPAEWCEDVLAALGLMAPTRQEPTP